MNDADYLTHELSIMLRQRAYAGNAQSKHGLEAAYQFEVYTFVELIDKLMTKDKP